MRNMTLNEARIAAIIHSMNGCTYGVIRGNVNMDRDTIIATMTGMDIEQWFHMTRVEGGIFFTLSEKGSEAYTQWLRGAV